MGRQIEDLYNSLTPEEREQRFGAGARLVREPAPRRNELEVALEALGNVPVRSPLVRNPADIRPGETFVHIKTAGVYKIAGLMNMQARLGWTDNAKIVIHQLLIDGIVCWFGTPNYDLITEGPGVKVLSMLPVWLQASAPLTHGAPYDFVLYASHVLGHPPELFLRERFEFAERFALLTGGEG